MRSQELDLKRYNTDKISNGYLAWYDPILQHLVHEETKLLELGIREGGSLLLWRDYFPRGLTVGIDLNLPTTMATEERIQIFQGSQTDTAFLSEVANKTAPAGFDVIIDDASHHGELTKVAFWHLFGRHLKPGGLYIIEDWGTGYWDDWPDGKSFQLPALSRPLWRRILDRIRKPPQVVATMYSHNYGMVGFIKQLIDEQGAADLTRKTLTGKPLRESQFAQMVITPSIVFITKNAKPQTSA